MGAPEGGVVCGEEAQRDRALGARKLPEAAARNRIRAEETAPAPAVTARAARLSAPPSKLPSARCPWQHMPHGTHIRSQKTHDVRALEPYGEAVRPDREGHHHGGQGRRP